MTDQFDRQPGTDPGPISARAQAWAATMAGHPDGGLVRAHRTSDARVGPAPVIDRVRREQREAELLRPGSSFASGAGQRAIEEEPDPERTCFERDRDRIVHSSAFRRLAGKTQVVVYPTDHQRTRLTHALEVAQVATSIARAAGVNVALTDAIALGHDCGHGPGGHASEEAFDPYVPGGYDHGPWGADVVLTGLNLCTETLDGIRNHSWSRPAPATVEGEIVSWADRIAYCAHDLEDAVHAGIVGLEDLPAEVIEICGATRRRQLDTFVRAVVRAVDDSGEVGMAPAEAAALAALRSFNYQRIYVREESLAQSRAVVAVLQALVEYYTDHPDSHPDPYPDPYPDPHPRTDPGPDVYADPAPRPALEPIRPGTPEAVRAAVGYVAGMTDRYAFRTAVRELGWDPARLPRGIDHPD